MIQLSISVQAHEKREQWFPYLKERLGNVPFSIDTGEKGSPENIGVWENNKRAWRMHDPFATHHVVIQDDALVTRDFKSKAEAFIGRMEEMDRKYKAFSFYYGKHPQTIVDGEKALPQGYIVKQNPRWGVAICLPTELIEPMIDDCDKMTNPQDDVRIGKFTRRGCQKCLSINHHPGCTRMDIGIPVYFPLPSLVSHRTGKENKSLVGDPGTERRALYFSEE